jgi:hypothetical protein
MKLETTTRTDDARPFVMPVPPALEAVLDERGVDELARHRELAGRYREAADAVGHARRELEQAGAADAEAERAFASDASATLPASKAGKAKARLEVAERERDVLGTELIRSASRLVRSSEPYVEEAAQRVAERSDEEAGAARLALELAAASLAERGATGREAAWLTAAAKPGARVHAWRQAPAPPDPAQQAVAQALLRHDEEVARRRERRRERLIEAEVMRLTEEGLPLYQARTQAQETLSKVPA